MSPSIDPASAFLDHLADAPPFPASYQLQVEDALSALDGAAPLLSGMVRYHLGLANADLQPSPTNATSQGKRMRPTVALLSAAAAGGRIEQAAPVAAAIELLHNFTLIHDDIQDQSPTRRHRSTVWNIWGIGQAINAGDAMFAAAHLPLFAMMADDARPELVLRLLKAFDLMTIEIVTGQTLDLGFEGRDDVSPDDYLRMIGGKTAAIVRYAAWAGALAGGASEEHAEQFAAFGLALGLGFQIQDDLLGIWGDAARMGKGAAEDIYRRKHSLPVLLLRERLASDELAEFDAMYANPRITETDVARVLRLMDEHDIQDLVRTRVDACHDDARAALLAAVASGDNPGRNRLLALVEQLASRAA